MELYYVIRTFVASTIYNVTGGRSPLIFRVGKFHICNEGPTLRSQEEYSEAYILQNRFAIYHVSARTGPFSPR